MDDREVRVFSDADALSRAAAEHLVAIALEAAHARGQALIALSGGNTPQGLYAILPQLPYRSQSPWAQMQFFWGDERCVPPGDPESNYGQAKREFLDRVPVPAENLHRVKGELEPDVAAQEYGLVLRQFSSDGLAWPRLDWVLLGMGADGHTASLFPGPISPKERERPVIAVTANYQGRPANRVSLTPRVFNSARSVVFLVTGEEKADALAGVLAGAPDPERWPAQRIRPETGSVLWLVDRPAASRLPKDFRPAPVTF